MGTLCSEIWHALAIRQDPLDMFRRWAESLSRHLGYAIVGIWLRDVQSSTFALQVVGGGAATDLNPLMQWARSDVELICDMQKPRIIRDFASDSRWREYRPLLAKHRIIALAAYPLILQSGADGAVVAFVRGNSDVVQFHLLETAIAEMSSAITRFWTETRLRQSHCALRTILQSAPLGLVGLDPTGNVTFWSRDAERMFGWSENDVLGRPFAQAVIENNAEFQEHANYSLRGRVIPQFEAIARRRDGARCDVGVTLAPQYADGSTVAGLIAVIVDVSERKNRDRRSSLQEKVSQILKNSRAANDALSRVMELVCLNQDWWGGEYWEIDRAAGRLRLTAAWRLPDKSLSVPARLGEERRLGDECGFLASVYRQGRPAWIENVACDRGSSSENPATPLVNRAAIGLPVRLSGNEVAGIFLFLGEDVLEPDSSVWESLTNVAEQVTQFLQRRQTEAQLAVAEENLRQSQKMEAIGSLAGGVAHDFNNMLTVIIGHSEIAQETLPANAPLRDLLREIEVAGKRAAALTRQLLAFSRKQPINPVVFNINRHVGEMERMLHSLIGKEIDLQTSLAPDVYPVKADPAQIEQVLLNLVVNARDAMPKGGRLVIRTANEHLDRPLWCEDDSAAMGAFVALTVSDSGCGMDEQTRARIFEPFFTTKPIGRGTGMGLATVFGIVKQSGGGITVESQPGQGTTFKVYLPRTRDALTAWCVDSAPAPIPGGTETILLVDDEDGVRAVVSSLLRVRGYTVLESANGVEALKICRRQSGRLDLVVSDVIMPGMTGDELARRIGAAYPQIKILQTSGFAGHFLADSKSETRRLPFLQKPFTSASLARKVREVLDQ